MKKQSKKLWNPGNISHSPPERKVPIGYLPPNQSKTGKKSGSK